MLYLCIAALSSNAKAQDAGYALQFDGVDDYVNVTASPSLDITSAITIEAWVNKSANVQWASVVTKGRSTSLTVNNYTLHFDSLGGLIFTHDAPPTAFSSLTFPSNEWHHVAVTWDRILIQFYVDGVIDSVATPDTGSLLPNNNDLTIGADFPGSVEYFPGQLDEVRLWNIARTQQQLQENMCRHLVGTETGLVGYWRFDEVSGGVTGDSSGHGNTGVLLNGPTWVPSSAPITGIRSLKGGMPSRFELEQNFPNPFNPTTSIRFTVPRTSFATLKVYNSLGEDVATLVSRQLVTGTHETEFNASGLASGTYFYRLQAGDFVETKKLLLLK